MQHTTGMRVKAVLLAALAASIALAGCVTKTTRTTYEASSPPPLPRELAAPTGVMSEPSGIGAPPALAAPEASFETGPAEGAALDEAAGGEGGEFQQITQEAEAEDETSPPGTREATLLDQYQGALLDSHRNEQADVVKQRISYPDELFGCAVIRSAQQPGAVTFFYPLRAVGGVTVDVMDKAITVKAANDQSVAPLLETLKRYLEADDTNQWVKWYSARNMLEIHALEANVPFIIELLEFLDAPQKQVSIEAGVWEITDVNDTQLGAQLKIEKATGSGTFFNMFNSRFDAQSFIDSLISGQVYQGSTLDFVTNAGSHNAKMTAVFQWLKSRGYADLVSQPRMRVAVGRTAKIMTGQQVPIQQVKLVRDQLEVYVNYKDVGVQLYVTPLIAGQDSVTLLVLPTISEVTGYSEPGPTGVSNPIISQREALTEVTVANGELITIGGLNQTKKTLIEKKIPLLGDIPVLGYLFKSKRETESRVQLWFTVQPTISNGQERLVVPESTGLPALR